MRPKFVKNKYLATLLAKNREEQQETIVGERKTLRYETFNEDSKESLDQVKHGGSQLNPLRSESSLDKGDKSLHKESNTEMDLESVRQSREREEREEREEKEEMEEREESEQQPGTELKSVIHEKV